MPSKQQRRSKQSKSSSATAAAAKAGAAKPATLEEQLANAQAAIEQSRQGITALHQQWKSHLLRLSYIVIFVSIHQAVPGLSACWEDTTSSSAPALQPGKRILFVAGDSFMQIMAIVVSLLLTSFLRASSATALLSENTTSWSSLMGHPTFLLANACIPVLVGLYSFSYYNSKQEQQKPMAGSSCLETAWFLQLPFVVDTSETASTSGSDKEDEAANDSTTLKRPGFPVVVIFSMLVTACYWFMAYQARQQERNRQAVLKVRRELIERKKKQ